MTGALCDTATRERRTYRGCPVVHGDGPQTRSSTPGTQTVLDRFGDQGFAVLVWDKPGSGESSGEFDQEQTLRQRAAILADGVGLLADHPGHRPLQRVGHVEGASASPSDSNKSLCRNRPRDGAATTNSASKPATNVYDWQQRSTNSPQHSDRASGTSPVCRAAPIDERNGARSGYLNTGSLPGHASRLHTV